MIGIPHEKALRFEYKNWKGDIGTRQVVPQEIWYGETEYHPQKQYFLKAYDLDKKALRDFALKDIIRFK